MTRWSKPHSQQTSLCCTEIGNPLQYHDAKRTSVLPFHHLFHLSLAQAVFHKLSFLSPARTRMFMTSSNLIMAGIPAHTASPINPNSPYEPNGVTPSTAAARYSPTDPTHRASNIPATAPATTTALPSPTWAAAQPGQGAVPAPTGTSQSPLNSQPTATATISTSRTRTASSPPSPQPGAFPSPTYSEARRACIPPPPKAGEIPKPAAFYASQYQGSPTPTYPHTLSLNTSLPPLAPHQTQGTLLTPTRAQPPGAVTSIATSTIMTQDLSHPPGYVQDSRASFSERLPELVSPISQNQSSHSRGRSMTGILDGGGGDDDMENEDKGLWGTAVSWAKTVSEKVIEGEEEVWKRINRSR